MASTCPCEGFLNRDFDCVERAVYRYDERQQIEATCALVLRDYRRFSKEVLEPRGVVGETGPRAAKSAFG